MNIYMQICGITIVAFLMVLYRSHQTMRLNSEKTFLTLMAVIILCLILDLSSVLVIRNREILPSFFVSFISKAYIISVVWVGLLDFCYIMLELNSTSASHNKTSRIMIVVTVVESIVTAVLPIHIYDDGVKLYTYGPAVISVYIFAAIYIFSTLNVSVYLLKNNNSRRATAALLAVASWILALVIQGFNNGLLVIGFSMAIGCMILYAVMENPDAYLDREYGCFNTYALHAYLKMLLQEKSSFGIINISTVDIRALEEKGLDINNAIKRLLNIASEEKEVYCFKNLSTEITIVVHNQDRLEKLQDAYFKVLSAHDELFEYIRVSSFKDAQRMETFEELQKLFSYLQIMIFNQRTAVFTTITDDMIEEYRRRQRIETEIALALDEDRVVVYLQPIFNGKENRFHSAEALVRIRNRDGSMLSPGQFIPVAEATGQIEFLGERVLEKVCEFLRDSEALSLGLEVVEINLSAVQCNDRGLAQRLYDIVRKYGVNPSHINFEITETAIAEFPEILMDNMNALIRYGFSFALDDFGKGESNLYSVVQMPVSFLKLDIDMTKSFFSNEKAKSVVRAIVSMTHALDLTIVSEGIETETEAREIMAEGADHIQGYYYSRPLPVNNFIEFLRKNKISSSNEDSGCKVVLESQLSPWVDMSGKKALLVEDNELNMEIEREILQMQGVEVDTAEDGTVAVEKIQQAKPGQYDIVFMDIHMPLMDGYEATRQIRAMNNSYKDIPIVALTGMNTEQDREEVKKVGMNAHILKPIDFDKMNEILVSYLGDNKG